LKARPTRRWKKSKLEIATTGPFAGLPISTVAVDRRTRRPTDEERAAYESSLTPEQKQKYQEVVAAMRAHARPRLTWRSAQAAVNV